MLGASVFAALLVGLVLGVAGHYALVRWRAPVGPVKEVLPRDTGLLTVAFDEKGTILTVNEALARVFERSEDDLAGWPVQRLLDDSEHEEAASIIEALPMQPMPQPYFARLLIGGTVEESIWLITAAPGGPHGRPCYLANGALLDHAGELGRARLRRWNQLEGRVAQRTEELEAANRELESFAYTVSHDLRAPLQTIVAMSDMLLEVFDEETDPGVVSSVELMAEAAVQMGRLVDVVLDYSRILRRPPQRETLATRELVQEVAAEQRLAMQAFDVDLHIADLPPCQADRVLIRQVFANLISNALKFSSDRQPACIEVGLEERDGEPVYFVRDNGMGFDPASERELFRAFQRQRGAQRVPGHGIGLATVKRIVESHGGEVWAEGRPGEGATFYFTLGPGDAEEASVHYERDAGSATAIKVFDSA